MSAPTPATRLAAAEAEAALARERMGQTLADLQARLDPKTLASSAARTSVDTALRNPGAVAGAAAVAGALLFRHRIARLWRSGETDR